MMLNYGSMALTACAAVLIANLGRLRAVADGPRASGTWRSKSGAALPGPGESHRRQLGNRDPSGDAAEQHQSQTSGQPNRRDGLGKRCCGCRCAGRRHGRRPFRPHDALDQGLAPNCEGTFEPHSLHAEDPVLSDLLVVEFPSEEKAEGVREMLLAMQKEYLCPRRRSGDTPCKQLSDRERPHPLRGLRCRAVRQLPPATGSCSKRRSGSACSQRDRVGC
jgi:hypothetical protein